MLEKQRRISWLILYFISIMKFSAYFEKITYSFFFNEIMIHFLRCLNRPFQLKYSYCITNDFSLGLTLFALEILILEIF
jgi:hypothetical protein